MNASRITAGALACTLASLAGAQQAPPTQKPINKAAVLLQQKLAAPALTPSSSSGSSGGSMSLVAIGSDVCNTPTPISGAGPFAFDTSLQTTGTQGQSEPLCLNAGQTGIGNDAWYAWTSGFTGTAIVNFCGTSTGDSKVAVYAGSGCPVAAAIACNDDVCPGFVSQLTFPATNATVYTIQVGKYPTSATVPSGTFSITLQPPPSGNNACAGATAISGPGPHAFNTVGATTDGPSNCGIFTNDVWFNWTAGATNTFEVSLCAGATYDSEVSIYDTSACQGALLACDDDFCLAFGPSKGTFSGTTGSVYKIQVGGYNGASGSGTFTVAPPAPPPTNDNCASLQVIAGPGPHNFNSTTATTGVEGQAEALCNAFATTGIDNDQWFKWTAGASGQATLSVCGTTGVDTKIAAYPGTPNCPPGGTVLACNDDTCGLQSEICWGVTSGQAYVIQLGTFPGAAGGTGTFSIAVGPASSPCQADDGSSEDILGLTAGGELVWIQRFGGAGSTNVTNIKVAWGSLAAPGNAPGNGTPVKVLLYDDPNNDGDPTDAVLIQTINTTVANVDTDILNTIPVTPVSLNGIFFAGAGQVHTAGQLVAAMDTSSSSCDTRSWLFGDDSGGAVNYASPSSNVIPPASFASQGFACNLLVRAGCNSSPMVQNCFPGTGGVIACPCGQPANATGGCANFGATATSGARLNATGNASLAGDTLVLTTTNHRTAPAAGILNVFFASTGTSIPNGVANGAGVRCYNQTLKRLYTGQTNPPASGSLSKPGMGDPSVSVRSAALSSPISAGQTRHYFNLYRDAAATAPAACNNTLSNVNVTNAGSVLWTP